MVSIAKRNSHAALEWAKQRHQQIQKAKEIKEHRLGNLKKFKELQSLNLTNNQDNHLKQNLQNQQQQRVPTPCVRKIISGRRKGNVIVTNTNNNNDISLSKIEEDEEEECNQQLDKITDCQKNNIKETAQVIKYGRRKTINNNDASLMDELDTIKEKIKKTKENLISEKRAFLPRWALEDDLLNKVREKLDAKINMLYGTNTNETIENQDKISKGHNMKDRTEQIQKLKKLISSRRMRKTNTDNNESTEQVKLTNTRYKKLSELKRKNKSQFNHASITTEINQIDNNIRNDDGDCDVLKDDKYKEPKYKCATCGRQFIKNSFDKHSQICVNVFKRKRKIFNSSKARTLGNIRYQYNTESSSNKKGEKNKKKLNSTWRQKSHELRSAILSINQK